MATELLQKTFQGGRLTRAAVLPLGTVDPLPGSAVFARSAVRTTLSPRPGVLRLALAGAALLAACGIEIGASALAVSTRPLWARSAVALAHGRLGAGSAFLALAIRARSAVGPTFGTRSVGAGRTVSTRREIS